MGWDRVGKVSQQEGGGKMNVRELDDTERFRKVEKESVCECNE